MMPSPPPVPSVAVLVSALAKPDGCKSTGYCDTATRRQGNAKQKPSTVHPDRKSEANLAARTGSLVLTKRKANRRKLLRKHCEKAGKHLKRT